MTDFGMAKLLGSDPHLTPTYCPGTNGYMSPEALADPPEYSEKLDVFSCGVLLIQLVTRKFPNPGPRTYTIQINDPRVPSGEVLVLVPELDRRREHLDLVPPTHPLLQVALDCIKDKEDDRPTSEQLCSRLVALKQSDGYQESLRQETDREQEMQQQLRERESRVEELAREVQQLQLEKEEDTTQRDELQLQIREKTSENQQLQQQIRATIQQNCEENRQLQQQVRAKTNEIQQLQQQIRVRSGENEQVVAALQQSVEQKDVAIRAKEGLLQEKEREIREKKSENQQLQQQIRATIQQNSEENRQLQQHVRAIENQQLQQEIPVRSGENEQVVAALQQSVEQEDAAKDELLQEKERESRELRQRVRGVVKGPLKLKWRDGPPAPSRIRGHSVVVSGDMVYLRDDDWSGKTLMFNSRRGQWIVLPECNKAFSSIAVVNGLLTAIGGEVSFRATNTLLSLSLDAPDISLERSGLISSHQ